MIVEGIFSRKEAKGAKPQSECFAPLAYAALRGIKIHNSSFCQRALVTMFKPLLIVDPA